MFVVVLVLAPHGFQIASMFVGLLGHTAGSAVGNAHLKMTSPGAVAAPEWDHIGC